MSDLKVTIPDMGDLGCEGIEVLVKGQTINKNDL